MSPPFSQSDLTTMAMIFDTAQRPTLAPFGIRLDGPSLGASSLTFLKPRLKAIVRPFAAKLANAGFIANQVTIASLAGSIGGGGVICANPGNTTLFALLPLLYGGLVLTIWNRLRFALPDKCKAS